MKREIFRVEAVASYLEKYKAPSHSAFRFDAGAAKILIDPFLSGNPSWHKRWIGSRAGEDSTRGGGR